MKSIYYLAAILCIALTGCKKEDSTVAISQTSSSAPTVTDGAITASAVASTSLSLTWNKATDANTDDTTLTYQTYYSSSNNISTYTTAATNGTAFGSPLTDTNTITITGLTPSTKYYFNTVVANTGGQKTAYTSTSATMTAAAAATKAITTFNFTAAANTALNADVSGTLTGTNIALTVPFGTDTTALVASFTTSGASVAVNSNNQTSGTTANDFSSPVSYLVTAADGSTQSYTVTVTVSTVTAKDITAFSFKAANNGALSVDVNGTITGTNIALTVPFGTNITGLVATFTQGGASIKIGTSEQISGTTANNFTSGVTYRVTAGDNSTQDYTVTVTLAADPTPPTVSSTLPANNATGVTSNKMTVTFDKNVDAATINSTNITFNNGLTGTFATAGNVVTITTSAQTASTLYSVTLGTGVKDTLGNGLASPQVIQFTSSSLLANIRALYSFDTDLNDTSGNNNHLTNLGTTQVVNGKIGGARAGDGTQNAHVATDLSNGNTGFVTVSFWAKITANSNAALLMLGDGAANQHLIQIVRPAGILAVGVGFEGGGYVTSTSALGTYYHIIFQYNAATKTVTIYVDNNETASYTGTAPDASGGLVMFSNRTSGGFGSYFQGELDEVVVWDRLLTAGERAALYNTGAGIAIRK